MAKPHWPRGEVGMTLPCWFVCAGVGEGISVIVCVCILAGMSLRACETKPLKKRLTGLLQCTPFL